MNWQSISRKLCEQYSCTTRPDGSLVPFTPVSPAELNSFEQQNSISLPPAYRNFLLNIGNGGPGPHRLFKIDLAAQYPDLAQPFIDPDYYNRILEPDCQPADEEERRLKELINNDDHEDTPLEEAFWQTHADTCSHGNLALADIGCGDRVILVLNGRHRGSIWHDYSVNCGGYEYRAADFVSWYSTWLNAPG